MKHLMCLLFVLSAIPAAAEVDPVPVSLPPHEPTPPLENLTPSRAPHHSEDDLETVRTRGRAIYYDLRTGRSKALPPASTPMFDEATKEYRGDPSRDTNQLSKDFGPYVEVTDPTAWPARTAVWLSIEWETESGDTRFGTCSGTLIDARHVITAGHCIYTDELNDGTDINDWAKSVEVFPAYDEGTKPFGHATATGFLSWDGWVQDDDYDHDVGLIALDRPIGAITGWRSVGSKRACSWYDGGTWTRYGYPGGMFGGENLLREVGDFNDCESHGNEVWSDKPGIPGSSGSGAVRDGTVWAIRSNSAVDLFTGWDAWDVRITGGKLADIVAAMDNELDPGADLTPLDVQAGAPSVVAAGFVSGSDFLVFNDSQVTANVNLQYDVYLSTDRTITTSDLLLESYGKNVSIPSLGTERIVFNSLQIPAGTSAGEYFLGVVLTSIDHDNQNDVTLPEDTAPIAVGCEVMPQPDIISPETGLTCQGSFQVQLDWSSVAGAASYEVEFDTACGGGTRYTTLFSGITVQGMNKETQYHWRVRAISGCGDAGPWSDCRTYRTRYNVNTSPISVDFPLENQVCVGLTQHFDWKAVGTTRNIAEWQIRLGESCGAGTPMTSPHSEFHQSTPLLPARLYHWSVRSRTSCGDYSNWSPCFEFTTADFNPAAPVPISPPDRSECVANNFLPLNWSLVPGILSHEVRWGPDADQVNAEDIIVTPVTGNTLLLGSLEENTRYSWSVRGKTGCGAWSDWSPWIDFVTFGGPLAAPEELEPGGVTVCSGTDVQLEWVEMPGAFHYQVEWSSGVTCTPTNSTIAQTSSHLLSGQPLGPLSYRVRAMNTCGEWGNWSACQTVDVSADSPNYQVGGQSTTHVPGLWSNSSEFESRLVARELEPSCEVAGWSVVFDTAPSTEADTSQDFEANPDDSMPYALTIPEGAAVYLHSRPITVAGTAGLDTGHLGPFSVDLTSPTGTLLAPLAGQSFPAGSVVAIKWLASDALSGIEETRVLYTVDGGISWDLITVETLQNLFHWTTPQNPSEFVRVRIEVEDAAGNVFTTETGDFTVGSPTGTPLAMGSVSLAPNRPNPFNPSTTIEFTVPADAPVRLTVLNVHGGVVRRLADDVLAGPARYARSWDGKDDSGRSVVSGVYFYRLDVGGSSRTRRMVLLK